MESNQQPVPKDSLLPLDVAHSRHELASRVNLCTFRNWAVRGVKTPNGVVRMKAVRIGRNLWVDLCSVTEFLTAVNRGGNLGEPKGGAQC